MIGLIADVHLGNHRTLGGQTVAGLNDRARETLAVLRAACRRAVERRCRTLAVLGDLFDTDNPSPQLIAATLEAFRDGPRKVVLLVGNHDQRSTLRGDHALAPFDGVWNGVYFSVIDKPTTVHAGDGKNPIDLALIPYQPGPAAEWFPEAIRKPTVRRGALLCFHLGVSDERTQAWLQGTHDAVTVDTVAEAIASEGFVGAASGNWHHHAVWEADNGEPIVQVGALVPTGWNNPGEDGYGSLVFWDGRTFSREVIPGPRYLKFASYDEWAPYSGREDIRARIVVPANRLEMTRVKVNSNDPMGVVEVLADEKTTQQRAQRAASAARAEADSDEALAAYVEQMEKPVTVTSAEVVALCQRFLGGQG